MADEGDALWTMLWREAAAGDADATAAEATKVTAIVCPVCGRGLLRVGSLPRRVWTDEGLRIASGWLTCPVCITAEHSERGSRPWAVTVHRQGRAVTARITLDDTSCRLLGVAISDELADALDELPSG